MADSTATPPEVSDAREAADIGAQQLYTDVLDQLTDPRGILANALVRVFKADAEMADSAGDPALDALERAMYQVETANALRGIAETAHILIASGGHRPLDDDQYADVEPTPGESGPSDVPQPTPGVRFTAELTGRYMGAVGGREWLHLPGWGFVDITGWGTITDDDEDIYRLRGRVVSATGTHVLLIDDGGIGHTLPRCWITERPDDQR